MTKPKYKVTMIAPTCFYWQVPLYRAIALHPRIDLKVYFCSDEALYTEDVSRAFNVDENWGVGAELLEGFDCRFVKNYSLSPSYTKWPFGLINPGVWREISKERPDAVVISAWTNITWWIAILACLRFGIPFLYHTDANGKAEPSKAKWKLWPKKILLGKLIFPLAAGFLYPGSANKQLFSFYGVPEKKLVPFAYSWGYETLIQSSEELAPSRNELRATLGIPENSRVIMFCGRLIKEKNIFDLLDAYRRLEYDDKALVLVGDGELRADLLDYASKNKLESVYFFGFQNRNEIAKYYAISDVLVLPSSAETWGIVVSEALCFGLPAIVSDQVGAGYDLVQHGQNGFIFPAGDVEALGNCLHAFMELSEKEMLAFRAKSQNLMKEWLQRDVGGNLVQYLDLMYSQQVEGPGEVSASRPRKRG